MVFFWPGPARHFTELRLRVIQCRWEGAEMGDDDFQASECFDVLNFFVIPSTRHTDSDEKKHGEAGV